MHCLSLAVFLHCFLGVAMNCVWYDCNDVKPAPEYFVYKGPPKPVESPEAIQILRSMCLDDYGNATIQHTTTCCSLKQLRYVRQSIGKAKPFVARCPQCLRNLKRYFCRMTCSGDQSDYMDVTDTKDGGKFVEAIRLNISEATMVGIYRSCDSLWVPSLGQKSMSLLCGRSDCDPFKLFTFMGSTENGFINFTINIKPTHRIRNVLTFEWRKCNESYGGEPPCGCEDCEDTCGPPWPEPNTEKPIQILHVDLISFIMICIFLAGILLLAIIIWLNEGFRPLMRFSNRRAITPVRHLLRRMSSSSRPHSNTNILRSPNTASDSSTKLPKAHRKGLREHKLQRGKIVFSKKAKAKIKAKEKEKEKEKRDNETEEVSEPSRKSNSCIRRHAELSAKMDNAFVILFTTTTKGMTAKPWIPLLVSCCIVALLSSGIVYLRVETDPIRLWSDKASQTRLERDYFNEQFGPFYRIEHLIIRPTDLSTFTTEVDDVLVTVGPVFRRNFLKAALDLQLSVQSITMSGGKNLSDVCFAPLVNNNQNISNCLILSIFGYIGNDMERLEKKDYISDFIKCINFPVKCLSPYGGPVQPNTILGGYPTRYTSSDFLLSTSIIITILVNNYNDEHRLEDSKNWEKKFIFHDLCGDGLFFPMTRRTSLLNNFSWCRAALSDIKGLMFSESYRIIYFTDFMEEWVEKKQPSLMNVAYHAERSFEDEIKKETQSDIIPLILSYSCMFIYIALGLGRRIGAPKYFVYSKMALGLGGILIVIASVASSVGFFSAVGVPVTMIVIEVVPFLVLAVGTDNMFIMVQTLNNTPALEGESERQRVVRVMGLVGPSTLLTTAAEVSCFLLGALSPMPAVQQFCLYAGVALLFAFLLQFSSFVALLALDTQREKDGRLDVLCCVKSETAGPPPSLLPCKLFHRYVLPALFRPTVRVVIVILFWALFCFTITRQPKVPIGLDTADVMDKNSPSAEYLRALSEMKIGPPVFFVVREGLNYTDESIQNGICGSYGSNANSLVQMIHQASRSHSWTYIASPAASWLDDLIDWTTAKSSSEDICCQFFNTNWTYCSPDIEDSEDYCTPCAKYTTQLRRPRSTVFGKFLTFFLQAIPNDRCPKAGHAAYSTAIKTWPSQDGLQVGATSYMTYHTTLSTSKDYINAMRSAREVANKITGMLRQRTGQSTVDVFPYSVFYVFYEQFQTMRKDVLIQSCYAFLAVGICFFVSSGLDIIGTLALLIPIIGIWSCMWSMMAILNVPLNALSLVNIILAIGISVEFCGHTILSYTHSEEETSVDKATETLITTGYSVFTGITMTKVIGITLLAFAKSPIYNIFYFRMYLAIVLLGALYGLVLTPVMMSYFGEMGADTFWNEKQEVMKRLSTNNSRQTNEQRSV